MSRLDIRKLARRRPAIIFIREPVKNYLVDFSAKGVPHPPTPSPHIGHIDHKVVQGNSESTFICYTLYIILYF